jgi:hypothetical protein
MLGSFDLTGDEIGICSHEDDDGEHIWTVNFGWGGNPTEGLTDSVTIVLSDKQYASLLDQTKNPYSTEED